MSGAGPLRRVAARVTWALFKRELVGVDELGNKYFRKLERSTEGEDVERRFVKYAGDPDPTTLPAEWHQYLHKSRAEPPTEEDIKRGQHQRELFRQRVAAIEAEEAARRFQQQTGSSSAGEFVQQLPEGGGSSKAQ